MKNYAYFLAAVSAILLSACNEQKPIAETGAAVSAATQATLDSAAAGTLAHSGMKMDGGKSPQQAAMNEMMQLMMAEKPKGNTDHDFAHMMLAHHQGAVAMADIQLRDGKDAAMRRLAEQIKADQLQEITALEAAATRLDSAPTNYQPNDPADPFTSKMKASMDAMMQLPKAVADPDMNFNMLMTVHHQSAVDMAKAELAHGKDTKLKQMAQLIITAQEKEIAAFKDWHNKNGDKM